MRINSSSYVGSLASILVTCTVVSNVVSPAPATSRPARNAVRLAGPFDGRHARPALNVRELRPVAVTLRVVCGRRAGLDVDQIL
jgi:hypothetical protein